MVRIDRVVTRGGDGGETSLGDGTRVGKDSARIVAIGEVDESNAAIGVLRAHVRADAAVDAMLARVQNDLFDLGADLCVPTDRGGRARLTDAPIARLEAEVAAMNATLAPLTSFVLSGGTDAAAWAHMARTIVRRAERAVVAVGGVSPPVVRYLNRLSDLLFVLARVLNGNGAGDVLWVPTNLSRGGG
ncbi:MAG TPA: cob(I)yrinic acid a,c-diamide adenosyltransferase [Acetobacteraceae bacterium]